MQNKKHRLVVTKKKKKHVHQICVLWLNSDFFLCWFFSWTGEIMNYSLLLPVKWTEWIQLKQNVAAKKKNKEQISPDFLLITPPSFNHLGQCVVFLVQCCFIWHKPRWGSHWACWDSCLIDVVSGGQIFLWNAVFDTPLNSNPWLVFSLCMLVILFVVMVTLFMATSVTLSSICRLNWQTNGWTNQNACHWLRHKIKLSCCPIITVYKGCRSLL